MSILSIPSTPDAIGIYDSLLHSQLKNMETTVQVAVLIVDNDKKAQKSIFDVVSRRGISCQVFESASIFRQLVTTEPVGCMFIGSELDDLPGVELLRLLRAKGWNVPTIITAQAATVDSCANAFLNGAVAYLEKPVPLERLEASLSRAIDLCTQKKIGEDQRHAAIAKLATLTQREKEVVAKIVQGLPIKSIAALFGTSFQAVARHRQRILDKLSLSNDVVLTRWILEMRVMDELPIESVEPT
ncbi:MAG: response regulator [Pirellula sp.]|nr:response regulator [Pirellula sp.]